MNKAARLLLNLLLLLSAPLIVAEEEDLLDPKEAFALSVEAKDSSSLVARWQIADGYYLYRNKFKFQSNTGASVFENQAGFKERIEILNSDHQIHGDAYFHDEIDNKRVTWRPVT